MTELKGNLFSVKTFLVFAIPIFLVIYVFWLCLILFWWQGKDDLGLAGSFGDSFGVLNAFFSGAALIAIAMSIMQAQKQVEQAQKQIVLAQEQLEIQQQELEQNTAALLLQRDEMKDQNVSLRRQAIQNQFFQMLESWQGMIPYITMVMPAERWNEDFGRECEGRETFTLLSGLFSQASRKIPRTGEDSKGRARRRLITKSSDDIFKDCQVELNQYFRLLYHIVRFVHDSDSNIVTDEAKLDYARIVRAHLSEAELRVWFHNLMTFHADKMIPLAIRYDLLQNMSYTPDDEYEIEYLKRLRGGWEAEEARIAHAILHQTDIDI